MTDWIKCSDRLPETHREVLACRHGYVTATRLTNGWGKNVNRIYWAGCSTAGLDYFDYWMPLPSPPKDEP